MGKEIEKKFLVKGTNWKNLAEGIVYRQAYLSTKKENVVRVRIVGDKGYLTVKGLNLGVSRLEYEYEIPIIDAKEILNNLCKKPIIEKKRYKIKFEGLMWEVDEFLGKNKGLIIAEVELSYETQEIKKPVWIGREVTSESKFFNSNLVSNPYSKW